MYCAFWRFDSDHVKLYGSRVLTVKAHPETIFALEQKYSDEFEKLKKELKISVNTESDNQLHRESFTVDGK